MIGGGTSRRRNARRTSEGEAQAVAASKDSFGARATLDVDGTEYDIFRLRAVEGAERLPFSLKVLLENLLRTEDGANITADHIRALGGWDAYAEPDTEIQFTPARVVMQDFTGVPCIVDLATMREAVSALGGDPKKVNPLAPAELVIDHSVIADLERALGSEAVRAGHPPHLLVQSPLTHHAVASSCAARG